METTSQVPLFGHLEADMGNEARVIVGILKVAF